MLFGGREHDADAEVIRAVVERDARRVPRRRQRARLAADDQPGNLAHCRRVEVVARVNLVQVQGDAEEPRSASSGSAADPACPIQIKSVYSAGVGVNRIRKNKKCMASGTSEFSYVMLVAYPAGASVQASPRTICLTRAAAVAIPRPGVETRSVRSMKELQRYPAPSVRTGCTRIIVPSVYRKRRATSPRMASASQGRAAIAAATLSRIASHVASHGASRIAGVDPLSPMQIKSIYSAWAWLSN